MSKATQMTALEFERRIRQFCYKNVLPGNVAVGRPWTSEEIARVMMKKLINADWAENEAFKSSIYDPANLEDKLSIQQDLRMQYYADNNLDKFGKAINSRDLIETDSIPMMAQRQSC